jgi:alkanesulfonate monooxygenase SsuD/methylene tetrahydromethanopterin reductase-like flavin-dependent oxidoreductase (luciferase family)
MELPRIGFNLPTFGPHAGPAGVVRIARAVEEVGFHSVSATERLLLPAHPGWSNDAGLPDTPVWEPLEVLTWAAAHTSRIRVGTAIVNAIFQSPIVLARRLATIDLLSGGRLDAGLGQGGGGGPATSFRLAEEFVAAGVPLARRGAGFVEHVAAMRACWGPDPVEFQGEHYQIPCSKVGPKPAAGTIPLLFGALTQPTIERAARLDGGVIIVALDWAYTETQLRWYREAGGVGPVVLIPVRLDFTAQTGPATFAANAAADLERAASLGADEAHFELNLVGLSPDEQVRHIEALAARLSG